MFWDLYQQSQINSATREANEARRTAEKAAASTGQMLNSLEGKINSLALTCQALHEILQEQNAISDGQLEKKMEEIDLRDGTRDGRITPQSRTCNGCGRRASPTRSRCLYCGDICQAD